MRRENTNQDLVYPLGYIPALDGIRGIAILLVLLFHTVPQFTGGFLGVDLFFVLSGYLITGILLRQRILDRAQLLEFYRRRALRLLPALFVLCLVFSFFALLALPDKIGAANDVIASLTSIANWTRAFGLGYPRHLGHTWSLAIEDQFYLLWPIALAGLLRFTNVRAALGATIVIILACIFWRMWLILDGATVERVYNGFDTRCDALLIGCALALSGLTQPSGSSGLVQSVVRWLWVPCTLGLLAIMASFRWGDRAMFMGGYSAVAVVAAVLITAATQPTYFARMAAWPPLIAVGRISYALYLWHYPISFVLVIDYGQPALRSVVLTWLLSFAAASASYVFVERPLSRLRYGEAASRARILGPIAAAFMICSIAGGAIYFFSPAIIDRYRSVEIVDFGPHDVVRGQPFNPQPNGNSALWIRAARTVPLRTRIQFGETPLNTFINGAMLTAEVPASLLARSGSVPIILVAPDGNRIAGPVQLTIKDPSN